MSGTCAAARTRASSIERDGARAGRALVDGEHEAALAHGSASGLAQDPAAIFVAAPFRRQHEKRRQLVRMEPLGLGQHGLGERRSRLDDHGDLVGELARALPLIDRDHAGEDVDASRKPRGNESVSDPLGVVEACKRRVNQNRTIVLGHQFTIRPDATDRLAIERAPHPL